jgi:hypothetical protein
VGQGFGVGRAVSNKSGCDLVDDDLDGLNVKCRANGRWVVRLG